MTVEIICVGTEILLGNIVNTNAAFLAERLAYLGLTCYYQSVVGDNAKRLSQTIRTAVDRSDLVILSGGLGPTEDDLTKETAAAVFDLPLVEDPVSKEHIVTFFKTRNRTIADNNWKQAMIPKGSIALENENGTAPGIIMEKDGKTMILLPGPPNELRPMFLEQVEPYLLKQRNASICSQMVKMCGIGESDAETAILDLTASTNPTVATYAKTGEVHIRVTAFAPTEEAAAKLVKPMVNKLKSRFGSKIYTTDPEITLEQSIVELLAVNKMTVTTAESCTGGLVAARLINAPGASSVLNEAFITYSNKAKRHYLDVKKGTLKKFGAVSEETALEMARGGCISTKADACIAVTGIAGPDGGTAEKPVGLVYIGCCVAGKTIAKECHFTGNRAKIRESACAEALNTLRNCILEYLSETRFT
ncbi:MAG: competence/damage-inducible protein A [Lachnospiraceae bacterium]|nr:competence/damage-inducible protein A [Lachnospiraceae bacterium]